MSWIAPFRVGVRCADLSGNHNVEPHVKKLSEVHPSLRGLDLAEYSTAVATSILGGQPFSRWK